MQENHTLLCPVCFSSVRVKLCTAWRLQVSGRGVIQRVNKALSHDNTLFPQWYAEPPSKKQSLSRQPHQYLGLYLTFQLVQILLETSSSLFRIITMLLIFHIKEWYTYNFLTVFLLKEEKISSKTLFSSKSSKWKHKRSVSREAKGPNPNFWSEDSTKEMEAPSPPRLDAHLEFMLQTYKPSWKHTRLLHNLRGNG